MRDGIVALTGVVHRCFTVSGEQQMRSCLSFSRMGLRGAELVEMTPNYWSFFAFFSIPIFSTARQDSSQVTCCFHVFNNSLRCMPCPRVAGWKCNEGKLLNMKETLNIWRVASIIYLALIDRRYLLIFCDTSLVVGVSHLIFSKKQEVWLSNFVGPGAMCKKIPSPPQDHRRRKSDRVG